MRVSTTIKKENFALWYELFECSGGKFASNPYDFGGFVSVDYVFDDIEQANKFDESFIRLTTPINETRRARIVKLKRKIKKMLRI